MKTILGISGSLRRGSYNTALLRAAAELMPESARLEVASIAGIPLYNGDVEESDGIPDDVARLKEQISAAKGLLIVTPEYNNSIPGVLKNAIDWASRPPADIERTFGGRKVAVIGASAGMFGTILAQSAWLPVLRTLGMDLWTEGRLMVPRAGSLMNDEGELADSKIRQRLRDFLQGFADFLE
jgi:NAD(P)H-dependent FMN reductase